MLYKPQPSNKLTKQFNKVLIYFHFRQSYKDGGARKMLMFSCGRPTSYKKFKNHWFRIKA